MAGAENLALEIQECGANGYLLQDKFLGKGNYASVFLAQPKEEQLEKNSKLRLLLKPGQRVPNVSAALVK